MSIRAIVFSKDRASQLHLLLESMEKNAVGLFDDISVLYKASTDEFDKGYARIRYGKEGFRLLRETNFAPNLLSELFLETGIDNICFLTDDDIFYRQPNVNLIKQNLGMMNEEHSDLLCYSLRLGSNIFLQDQYNRIQCGPLWSRTYMQTIMWDWRLRRKEFQDNYSYPMSVDGHIFNTNLIRGFLKGLEFNNPNSLESRMDSVCEEKLSHRPVMMSGHLSCVVNTPINRVQNTCENRAGETYGVSPEQLNDWYLNDMVLNLEDVEKTDVVGCHQEIGMRLRCIRK